MSLWSFWGLADAKSIHVVQTGLEELRKKQVDQFAAGIAKSQDITQRQGELLRFICGALAENTKISREQLDTIEH